MTTPDQPLAIMAAMPQEIEALDQLLDGASTQHRAGREYTLGTLNGKAVVLVHSRCGKVASATTAHDLISHFNARHIVFTGVAGGLDPALSIGDIVVGSSYVQHDMDARPLFPRFEIPLLGMSEFRPPAMPEALAAARAFLEHDLHDAVGRGPLERLSISAPKAVEGLILSGDRFVSCAKESAQLRADLPGALCVEMEGAAVAQVCHGFGVGFTSFRTISDTSDHTAPEDFWQSLAAIASAYSRGLVRRLLGEE
ncbi:MAG: adenosylhomocysteine nucleosidase [Phycisphaerales bacterium]|jgi:adenosylhomocysteine nucleosidase